MPTLKHISLLLACIFLLANCGDAFTDPATRIAYDIESANRHLGNSEYSTYSLQHQTPSKTGECDGPYKVQLDKVGALIIWCYDDAGNTVSSHSTSYHGKFIDTPQTYLLDKTAGETLVIDLERRNGRAVVVNVR
jgi:hypothetical protein